MFFRRVLERIVGLEAMQELGRTTDIWEESQSTCIVHEYSICSVGSARL